MEAVHFFVRGLFRGTPETARITEQREELETHINDRITDAVASGISEKEAFSAAVQSLGNLDELIDTITGEKKKIYSKKADWLIQALGLVYGTVYMIAIGVWFYWQDFGFLAVYIAIPGWLGFFVPALISFIDYRRHPGLISAVPVDYSEEIRSSIIGWAVISISCWLVNLLLVNSDTFLHVLWAWMPTCGVATWPLGHIVFARMVRSLKSLVPDSEA